jgi:BarA-like signal transduction histidine kinase
MPTKQDIPAIRLDADPAQLPDGATFLCDCVRVKHEHGNYATYKYHRCRCPECTEANAEYCRQTRVHRKRIPMADAAAARERVRELQKAGLLVTDIATLCGLRSDGLDFLMYGCKGRKATRILATTMKALQAISYRDIISLELPGTRRVDGDTARRQVQALHAHGWTASVLASRTGASRSSMSMLLSGHGIREDLRARIDAIYNELHGTEAPVTTRAERARSTIAKAKASANGWTTDIVHDPEYEDMLKAS